MQLSYTAGNVKDSLNRLSLFDGTTPELFRFITNSTRVIADKMQGSYITRCVINGNKCNENASDTADVLIIDGDSRIDVDGNVVNGAVSPLQVHLLLNFLGVDHFIHTTHSHQGVYAPKYRVIIPCTYTRSELPALLEWFFARLHENEIMLVNAKENSSWAQAWFLPSAPPERQHLIAKWWRVGGVSSDKRDVSEWFQPSECFWAERIVSEWKAKQRKPDNKAVKPPIIAPTGNVSAISPRVAFNAIYPIADVLTRNGCKQVGKRFLHPNSTSGSASIRILERGAYSTGSDALNDGKPHDAWDCYRLLECGGDYRMANNWNPEITKANQRAFYGK